jgi:hypothetical protein
MHFRAVAACCNRRWRVARGWALPSCRCRRRQGAELAVRAQFLIVAALAVRTCPCRGSARGAGQEDNSPTSRASPKAVARSRTRRGPSHQHGLINAVSHARDARSVKYSLGSRRRSRGLMVFAGAPHMCVRCICAFATVPHARASVPLPRDGARREAAGCRLATCLHSSVDVCPESSGGCPWLRAAEAVADDKQPARSHAPYKA